MSKAIKKIIECFKKYECLKYCDCKKSSGFIYYGQKSCPYLGNNLEPTTAYLLSKGLNAHLS